VRYDEGSGRFVGVRDWDENTQLRAMRVVAGLMRVSESGRRFVVTNSHIAVFGRNYILLSDIADKKYIPKAIRLLGELLDRIDVLLENVDDVLEEVMCFLREKEKRL